MLVQSLRIVEAHMSDMVHRLFQKHADVAVMQCIENVAAASLADHEPQMTQDSQLMRDG